MEETKGDITSENGEMVCGLDSREISKAFYFSAFPLISPIVVNDFKR